MPTFETNDRTPIHYEDWGEGPTIMFVAAWALNSTMWQYHMAALNDLGFRTVAYDRRGHGRSGRPGSGYDYDTLADDLAALMEHLDVDDVTLVTYSMGEGEGVRYLTRHGDGRIAKLVLTCPAGPLPMRTDDHPNGVDPAILAAVRDGWKQDFTAWMDAGQDGFFGVGLPGCAVSPGIVEWTRHEMMSTSLLALIEFYKSGTETDRRSDMAAVRVPTLIVQGDHDQSIPVELSGQLAAGLISGSELRIYENAPHGLFLTHRDRLTEDILEFAKR